MPWRRMEQVPLLLPALFLLSGTLVSGLIREVSPGVLLVLPAAAYTVTLLLYGLGWRTWCLAGILLGFFGTGVFLNQTDYRARQIEISRLQLFLEPGVAPLWEGFLYRDAEQFADRTVLHMQLESATHRDQSILLRSRARVVLYGPDGGVPPADFPELVYGDRLSLRTALFRPRNFRNPGMWDYAAYLERNGIYLTGSLKSTLQITYLGNLGGNRLLAVVYRIRREFRDYLEREFSAVDGGSEFSGILQALLFGERSNLSARVERLFQETGTYHVFVVSGFNTTLIAVFLVWGFRLLRVPHWLTLCTVGLTLSGYALMTELGAPVVRASILSFVVVLGESLFRKGNLLNSLSLAAVLTLVLWPDLAWDAGFQLTYAACLAIVLFGLPAVRYVVAPFRHALESLYAENRNLLRQDPVSRWARRLRFQLELAIEWCSRFVGIGTASQRRAAKVFRPIAAVYFYLAALLVVSLAIEITLAPLMAYLFNRANAVAFLANVFVVPIITFLMLSTLAIGGALCLLGWSWPPWVFVNGGLLEFLLDRLGDLASKEWWHWRVVSPPWPWMIIYFVFLAAVALPLGKRPRWVAFGLVCVMIPTFWWNPFPMVRHTREALEVYFLDVGQGDAILIVSPGGETLLVDGGGLIDADRVAESAAGGEFLGSRFDIGEDVVLRFLWKLRVRELNHVALTHPHQDHAGGLVAVVKNFKTLKIWGPAPVRRLEQLLPELTEAIRGKGLDWSGILRNADPEFGSLRMQVLNPSPSMLGPFDYVNNRSLVLRVGRPAGAVLLAGDVERAAEMDMIRDCDRLASNILKVAHHGSATSSSDPFLDCVQPRWAVISAGWNSRFSHPSPVVLNRLEARSVSVLETSKLGAVYAAVTDERTVVRALIPQ